VRVTVLLIWLIIPIFHAAAQDPDLPSFPGLQQRINKEDFLKARDQNISLRRGLGPGVSPATAATDRTNALRLFGSPSTTGPNLSLTNWVNLGPAPIPNGQVQNPTTTVPVSGRVTAVAVDPTNANIVYVGAAQGGLFRTLDGGTTWTALMDTAASLAIGAITVDPKDHTKVFVGTGEGNDCGDCFAGIGLYRIDNANTTPIVTGPFATRVTGTGTTASTTNAFVGSSITAIAVDPNNDNRIFVGNTLGFGGIGGILPPVLPPFFGLYFSENALSATPTFSLVSMGAGFTDFGRDAVTDVVFEPGSSSNLVMVLEDLLGGTAIDGIYRTTSADLASFAGGVPTFTRTLTFTTATNARLAINKVSSVVTVIAGENLSNGRLFRSQDGGQNWSGLTGANGFCDGQCFYDIPVAIDPTNADNIYIGGAADSGAAHTFQLSNNGTSATAASVTFASNDANLHADMHAIAVSPSAPLTIYVGNDGGIFKSTDGGFTWASLNNSGLSITQFMSVASHPLDRYFTIGGTQDNGTNFYQPSAAWTRADFGDGGFARIDQNAANNSSVTMYHTYFNQSPSQIGFARVTTVSNAHDGSWNFFGCGGTPNGISCSDTVNFYAPMELGPSNPNTLYFGTNFLYRSTNQGGTMAAVSQSLPSVASPSAISAIGIAPSNDNVRVVGLNNGTLWATNSGSSTLTQLTISNGSYIGRIAIDPTNTDIAYVAVNTFTGTNLFKTTNLNSGFPSVTFAASNSGLPAVPVDSLVIDPADHTSIFAGTDIGVYHSPDSGLTWTPFGVGLPAVACFDLAIQNLHRVLRVATHGRGIWEIGLSGAITAVQVTSFTATRNTDGRVLLAWQTGFGADDLGYRLYRQQGAQKTLITASLIAGGALLSSPTVKLAAGRSYAWTDAMLRGGAADYWLEVVHLNGTKDMYGPAGVKDSQTKLTLPANAKLLVDLGGGAKTQSTPQRRAGVPGMGAGLQAKANDVSPAALQTQAELASSPAIKISVKQEGWYRITQPQLAAAGLTPGIDPHTLQLFVDGTEVPISVTGEGDGTFDPADYIEFYAVGLDTAASDSRVYWLRAGKTAGMRMQQVPGASSAADPSAALRYSVELRPRTLYFSSLRNGDIENFFGPLVTSAPLDQVLTLHNVAANPPGAAKLQVTLQGATSGTHAVKILLNGTDLGTVAFTLQDEGVEQVDIPQSLLVEGDNTVRLTALSDDDVSLVDTISLTYWRRQSVDGDALRFTADAGRSLSLDSFTSPHIRVLDVTNPDQVREVTGAVSPTGSGFAIAFTVPDVGVRTLFAFVDGNVSQPSAVWANVPSSLRQPGPGAGMVILAHKSLMGTFDLLRQLRQAQGYQVRTVDVEDVFDEFSFGHKTPQAIRDFLSYSRDNWKTSPRAMLLVGHASYDPKNYLGAGDSDLVPTRMLDTVTMETASDDWFAAFGDDGLAQVQIGRIPARTAGEAALMVSKIIEHEAANADTGVTLVSDQTTTDFNFGAASDLLKPSVPSSLAVDDIREDQVDAVAAKRALLAGLQAGRSIVNYAGHGSVDLWRNNVLTSADALQLTNWSNLPLFVVMTCLNGYFEDPSLDSLSESLLKAPNGGASAVWAPSGMTDAGRQASMDQTFFQSVYNDNTVRTIGDAISKAKASAEDTDIRLTWALFGDPLMKKRPNDKLYDTAGKEIIFYHQVGCWANPPFNYQQILDQQQQEINQLMQTNTVIVIPCRASKDAV